MQAMSTCGCLINRSHWPGSLSTHTKGYGYGYDYG